MSAAPVYGLLLSGGASQRMQRDKALIQGDILLLPAPGAALDNVNTPEEFVRMQHQLERQS